MPARPRATIKDVARLAEVSIGSVSRVLNGHASVTEAIRRRVQAAVKDLAFRPDPAAQTMRSGLTRTVGCIVRDISIAGFAAFVRAADEVLMEAGYALLIANSRGSPERERQLASVMVARKADALIIGQYSGGQYSGGQYSGGQYSDRDREREPGLAGFLQASGMPVVLIDRDEPLWADAVMLDHRGGVRAATEKLLALGHRRIALLTGRATLFPARERIRGFREAFERQQLVAPAALIRTGSFEREFGFEQTSLLLAGPDRPTAIVTGGIDMLPGIMRAIRVRNLAIPGDVSLVAALDSDLGEMFDPPVSVVHWDYAEVGRLAARFALERIGAVPGAAAKRLTCSTRFILRESVGAPADLNETLS